MSLLDKFRNGYTETERSGLVSSFDGTIIDVNMNLIPSNGETVFGPIVDPPLIDYDIDPGPSADTQALIDRFNAALEGLGSAAGGVQAAVPLSQTFIFGDGGDDDGNGFDLGSFGGGLGLGAIAALVLMLALGSKK